VKESTQTWRKTRRGGEKVHQLHKPRYAALIRKGGDVAASITRKRNSKREVRDEKKKDSIANRRRSGRLTANGGRRREDGRQKCKKRPAYEEPNDPDLREIFRPELLRKGLKSED